MRTHELADALKKLSSILKSGPDIELGEVSELFGLYSQANTSRSARRSADSPLPMTALFSISGIDKREWIDLIMDLQLPIKIRVRDGARDIMGKVIRYMEANPESKELFEARIQSKDNRTSPELARALSSLLGK